MRQGLLGLQLPAPERTSHGIFLNDKTNTIPVIVSLTTIESRLKKVHITLRSVMNQSKKPEKIILWINDNDKNKIPKSLNILAGDLLEIKFLK